MTPATDQPAGCHREGHEQIPAAAVVVYHAQGAILGELLCRDCATCRDGTCQRLAAVLDTDYDEPWCLPHAAGFGPHEQPDGAEIVPLGSQRHAELLAAPDTSA